MICNENNTRSAHKSIEYQVFPKKLVCTLSPDYWAIGCVPIVTPAGGLGRCFTIDSQIIAIDKGIRANARHAGRNRDARQADTSGECTIANARHAGGNLITLICSARRVAD